MLQVLSIEDEASWKILSASQSCLIFPSDTAAKAHVQEFHIGMRYDMVGSAAL